VEDADPAADGHEIVIPTDANCAYIGERGPVAFDVRDHSEFLDLLHTWLLALLTTANRS
jgi:hypothetical protein